MALAALLLLFDLGGFAWAETLDAWNEQTGARVRSALKIPSNAEKLKKPHTVELPFNVDRSGKISSETIVRRSGVDALDKAALDAVKAVDPLPAPPLPEQVHTYVVTAPVRFRPRSEASPERAERSTSSLERAKRSIGSICTGC